PACWCVRSPAISLTAHPRMVTSPSSHSMRRPYPSTADYALIGDCHTAALIARDGSVDWFCPGRFDAPAVFCRLLDAERGGYLQTAPTANYSVQRSYHGATNVLESTFSVDGGRM